MPLLEGINHLTLITKGHGPAADEDKEGLGHAFIEVAPNTVLHPFQLRQDETSPPPTEPMFGRGRLDHFGPNAANEDAFRELRRRLVAEGATDGKVRDMGSMLILNFRDADGGWAELMLLEAGLPMEQARRRAEWIDVEMD